jgi:C1A family cysteine protease
MEKKEQKTVQKPVRVYGWKPSLPSHRSNFLLVAHPTVVATFPKQKFLGGLPPVYDQGQLGSCTANALAGAFEFEQDKQGLQDFMPSRLFIYYNERVLQGTVGADSGASLDEGIQTLSSQGVCSETTWPYDITQFKVQPPTTAYTEATSHEILGSRKIPTNINGFKTIINMGYPVAFGFTVFSYMESQQMANTGVLKMPGTNEQPIGGHAVVCVGYSDTMKSHDGVHTGYLKIRNSWGIDWGQAGYFWMPYDYVNAGYCDDLVVITKNETAMVKLNKEMSVPKRLA